MPRFPAPSSPQGHFYALLERLALQELHGNERSWELHVEGVNLLRARIE